MPPTRNMKSSAMSNELSKVYEWNDLHISEELVAVGKELDQAVQLTNAVDLKDKMLGMRKQLFHALSIEKQGPSEEGLTAADKAEERVQNREAIASSAADARGITGAEKDRLIAEATTKERAKLMESVKKQEEEMQQKLDEAKAQRELAERLKQEAEQRQQIAAAQAEREKAEVDAELQRTRSRARAEEESKTKLEAILTNVRRKRQNEESIDEADLAEAPAPPKKRKTAEEAAEERLQKLIDKMGDEEEGRRLYQKQEDDRTKAKEKKAADKEQALREKLCSELEHERKALLKKLERAETALKTQDEEVKKLRSEIKKPSSQSGRTELVKQLEKTDAVCKAQKKKLEAEAEAFMALQKDMNSLQQELIAKEKKESEMAEKTETAQQVEKVYKMLSKAIKVHTGLSDKEYKAMKKTVLEKCGMID